MATSRAPLDAGESLLVALSRVRPAPLRSALELAGVNLESFLFTASRTANFSLVARQLLRLVPELDAQTRARIERNLNHLDLRERLALADVAELARFLHGKGEPLVLLKGGAYARFIYPERGLRSFLDIDVLLRPAAIPEAKALLGRLGYGVLHEIEGAIDMSRAVGASPISLKIELHTDLVHHHNFPWYRAQLSLQEERLIARSEQRQLDGAPVRVLSAPDELLYSILHFFYHHDLEGLKYHSDLNALLHDPLRPMDPVAAIETVRSARAEHAVGLALAVQETLFGPGAVPAGLLTALAPRGLRRWLLERVLPPFERLPLLAEGRLASHPAKILAAPGLSAPLGLGLRWLFPGRRFLEGFYGVPAGSWRPSYHLRYPLAIVAKAFRRGVAAGAIAAGL